MKKVLLIISLVLIVAGGVVSGLSIKGFIEKNNAKYEEVSTDVDQEFTKINIDTHVSDIYIRMSSDESCKVVCVERETTKHEVKVEDGTLKITSEDKTKFIDSLFSIDTRPVSATIYLNKTLYEDLIIVGRTGDVNVEKGFTFNTADIKVSTGDVNFTSDVTLLLNISGSTAGLLVKDVNAKDIKLKATTGDIEVKNTNVTDSLTINGQTSKIRLESIRCKELTSNNTTGDVKVKDVIVENKMTIIASTGDISLDKCDAETLYLKATTGDIKGTLLSGKTFKATTSTGKNYTSPTTGGECEVITTTGDINIEVIE